MWLDEPWTVISNGKEMSFVSQPCAKPDQGCRALKGLQVGDMHVFAIVWLSDSTNNPNDVVFIRLLPATGSHLDGILPDLFMLFRT